MEKYQPPFSITNKMLSYVASISEKLGSISVKANPESKPHLRKNNRIRSRHSSLKIEANSLTLRQVFPNGIHGFSMRSGTGNILFRDIQEM